MEQTDQLQPAGIQAPSSQPVASAATRLRDLAFLRLLWRHRVIVAGLLAIGMAVAGELLIRSVVPANPADPTATQPSSNAGQIGSVLVGIAVLLVGLVAWVNDGFGKGAEFRVPSTELGEGADESVPIRTRTVRSRAEGGTANQQAGTATVHRPPSTVGTRFSALGTRYSVARTRLGWYGTAAGLGVALALSIWLGLFLRDSWTNPLAGWVWLAIMVVLVVTFAGVRPWPKGASLITHDPAEPAYEPPIARSEWIILGVIMLAAVVLRLWHLDTIPVGPYIDESGRALDARNLNYGLPVNRETFVFFGTGWWGVPSFYFWLVAQSMKVFGDDLLGARVIHALAGIGTVWFTYRIGRVVWSPRAGLVAGALMAISDLAIQASRTAGESTITLFFWTLCFYYLLKAVKTRQPLDFVLSGLAGGFVLLGYASGKLLPLFLVPAAIYLLVRWGFTGFRRYLPGLALLAVAAAVVALPNLVFQATQKPAAFTERYGSVTIFTDQRKAELATQYGSDNLGVIIARQYIAAYSAYDVGQEKGPFYPTGQPVLPVLWAALWVLGTAYVVWRLGDARYAILGVWLLGALGGSAFTIETPTLQRALMVVPLLALFPALFVDRVASGVPPLTERLRSIKPSQARLKRWATTGVIGAFIIFSAFQTLTYYFGPYTAKALYVEFTLAGDYMAKLDPDHDVVYDTGLPVMFGDPSPLLFLNKNIPEHDLANLSDALPVTENFGKDVHFMVAPPDDPNIPLLQSYYPGGTLTMLSKPDGTPVVAVYHVTAEEIDQERYFAVRYRMPDGVLRERQEPRLGTLDSGGGQRAATQNFSVPPDGLVYPTTADWLGGLVIPAYGTYKLQLDAPAGATLDIDGQQVLTATASAAGTPPVQGRVLLSRGLHSVKLHGTLDSANAKVALMWATDNGEFVPVGREFFWSGPQGTLAGQAYGGLGDVRWMMQEEMPALGFLPGVLRNDGGFSWSNLAGSLQTGPNPFVVWRGTLVAPQDGDYGFEAVTPGAVVILIDGHIVGNSNVPGTENRWPVNVTLAAGKYPFEVRFYSNADSSPFKLFWQPPGGARTLLPPDALLPAESGAAIAYQNTPGPSPDSSVIHSELHKNVHVAATMQESGWKSVLGITVLPDGRYAVGDSGAHKLIIYGADGKEQATWGSMPDANGSNVADIFNDVSDLALGYGGTIVALDAENGDIRIFDAQGHQTARLPREQMGLTHSRGLAVGPDGKFYVADTGASRVVRIDQSGSIEIIYNQGNGSIKNLEQPIDVAVAPDGSVYVVDLLRRIVKFDPTGVAQQEWQVPMGGSSGGSKLALWNGLIVVSNPDSSSLAALDPQAGLVYQIRTEDDKPLELNSPTGVAVGPDNRLYIVDSVNSRVVVLTGGQ